MESASAEPGGRCYTINYITPETYRSARLAARARREGGITFLFSPEPLLPGAVDAYLLQAEAMEQLLGRHERFGTMPVLVAGPPALLSRAFALGCIDYLREPWSFDELKARVLHRLPAPVLACPEAEVQLREGLLTGGPEEVSLTEEECRIMRLLLANRGGTVYREALELAVWGKISSTAGGASSGRPRSRSLDMHISFLRKKIRRAGGLPAETNPIEAVRRCGYRLAVTCGPGGRCGPS